MSPRFRRLTDQEARELTPGKLLDRVAAEQRYWMRKGGSLTPEDMDGLREFRRIMHAYLNPGGGLESLRLYLETGADDGYFGRPVGKAAR